jgi:hypothetical protein
MSGSGGAMTKAVAVGRVNAGCNSQCECDTTEIADVARGCKDSKATNFDLKAVVDDGSCTYPAPTGAPTFEPVTDAQEKSTTGKKSSDDSMGMILGIVVGVLVSVVAVAVMYVVRGGGSSKREGAYAPKRMPSQQQMMQAPVVMASQPTHMQPSQGVQI